MTLTTPRTRDLLALSITALTCSAANAQLTWTGNAGDGRWETAGNWDLGVAPLDSDEVIVNGDTVTFSDPAVRNNFFRKAPTTFNNNANFNIVEDRFLNAEAVNATFNWDSSGTLDHSGNYFIVGRSGATGVFNQTDGLVDVFITDTDGGNVGFFMSDSNGFDGSQGVYNLTGGTLNVNFDGLTSKSGNFFLGRSHNRIDTSINNGHDLFVVDGGTFNLSDPATNRNARFRRSSKFQLDSGTVNMDTTSIYFGDGNFNVGDVAELEINGGTMNVNTDIAMLLGQNGTNAGKFTMNGGALNVTSGDFWIGNEGYGTAEQFAGDITIAWDLVIDRGATVQADPSIYNMYGGSLTADELEIGPTPNAGSAFNFYGGVITLTGGDQRSLINEPWFNLVNGGFASFDPISNTTTIVIPEPATLGLATLGSAMLLRRRR